MNDSESSPDSHGVGLLSEPLDALRYDSHAHSSYEVPGILNAMMPDHARVLDVGCGTGSVTLIANASKENDLWAIEPDSQRAALASSRGINVHCGLLDEGFVRRSAPFDVVMFADVLEHMPAPVLVLRQAIDGLKQGGFVLASVPNVAHWTVRLRLLFGKFDYTSVGIMDATHLRWFTGKTFIALFESAGMEVVEVRHSAGVLMSEYQHPLFRIVPSRIRIWCIRRATSVLPGLFGCQIVIKARKR